MTQLASLADDEDDESASVVRVSQEEITLLEEMVTGAPAKDFAVDERVRELVRRRRSSQGEKEYVGFPMCFCLGVRF